MAKKNVLGSDPFAKMGTEPETPVRAERLFTPQRRPKTGAAGEAERKRLRKEAAARRREEARKEVLKAETRREAAKKAAATKAEKKKAAEEKAKARAEARKKAPAAKKAEAAAKTKAAEEKAAARKADAEAKKAEEAKAPEREAAVKPSAVAAASDAPPEPRPAAPTPADREIAKVLSAFEDKLRETVRAAGGEDRLREVEPVLSSTLDSLESRLERALELAGGRTEPARDDRGLGESLRDVLSPSTYLRALDRGRMRNRGEEVDEFGLDPVYEEATLPLFEYLYRSYFRVDADGFEHVPNDGAALIVANHSGVLPYDAAMIKMAVRLEHPSKRLVRPLIEDFPFHFPFLGPICARLGAVRACQPNAQRVLEKGYLAAVFPEGIRGNIKPYRDRYQLQRFGRGGFIKLCITTGAPIIPTAVIGAEEIHPVVARADWIGKLLGLPAFPITPTMPWLGPVGLLPLPSKWFIQFGEPIDLSEYGPDAADDEILVNRLTFKIRTVIQEMIKEGLKQRRSPFLG